MTILVGVLCEAVSMGIGKRFCEKCGLFNGSIGIEGSKLGIGAGYNFRF